MTTMRDLTELERTITIKLYKDIRNAEELRTITKDDTNNYYAVVDLHNVYNIFHIKTATMKALVNSYTKKMKTRSLSTEILYQLASTTKINEALSQFSIKSNSNSIGVIIIDDTQGNSLSGNSVVNSDASFVDSGANSGKGTDTNSAQEFLKLVNGTELEPSEFDSISMSNKEKADKMKGMFHISAFELEIARLEQCICNRLATKDI